MNAYTETGTRCSGPGYGYSLIQGTESTPDTFNPGTFYQQPVYGVRLSWQGIARIVWTGADYTDARELAYRFASIGRAWHVYTSRLEAHARGIATIG